MHFEELLQDRDLTFHDFAEGLRRFKPGRAVCFRKLLETSGPRRPFHAERNAGASQRCQSALAERARDLQRQLGLLGEGRKRRGRSAGRSGHTSGLRRLRKKTASVSATASALSFLSVPGEVDTPCCAPFPPPPYSANFLRGVKVPPKYRGPGGETWAGRGAKPRWLAALLQEGHSLDDFAITAKGGKAAAAATKKVVARKMRKTAGKTGQRKQG